MGSIWTQEWTQCEFFFIDFIGFIWTHCGPTAKKKNPINVISIEFSKKLASRRGVEPLLPR